MRIKVEGGKPLNGSYAPSGSANAAAACLAAALMSEHPVTLANVPKTTTTGALLELAAFLGAEISGGEDKTPIELLTTQIAKRHLTPAVTGGMVGGMLFVAPILTRRGFVRLEVDFPLNRVRTHLEALRDLKQDVSIVGGAVEINAAKWDSLDILLSQTSVTATGMVILLAAALGRETVIHNAASEPHVQDLARFLVAMGASIDGIGTNTITIHGGRPLHGCTYQIGPDHIEVGSFIGLAAVTRSEITIERAGVEHLRSTLMGFERLGVVCRIEGEDLVVPGKQDMVIRSDLGGAVPKLEDQPWPAFPADTMSIALVTATQCEGVIVIHEKMFESRLFFVDKLIGMGARIVLCDPHRAVVVGPTKLHSGRVDSPDIRAGMAMLLAALCAEGESIIDNVGQIERGYERIDERLRALGAKVERVEDRRTR